jgi:hypothetical protein
VYHLAMFLSAHPAPIILKQVRGTAARGAGILRRELGECSRQVTGCVTALGKPPPYGRGSEKPCEIRKADTQPRPLSPQKRLAQPQHQAIANTAHGHHAGPTRISQETRTFLAAKPNRFKYVLTSTHGSWLNIVETLFGKMARTFLRHIRVKSWEELRDRILRAIEEINADPVVHRWKKFDALTNA